MNTKLVRTACPHDCPSSCALEVELLSNSKIGRVRGSKTLPFTAGTICEKVSRYAERVHNPKRLKYPMRRVGRKGEGKFVRIDWAEAIDSISNAFSEAKSSFGAEAIWPYHSGGTMGVVQRYGMVRLARTLGYSDIKNTICVTPAASGWQAGVGAQRGVDPMEINEADLIIVWGGNPVHTNINLMSHIQKARKKRGAKLVVIDVYHTATMAVADVGLILKPGTDGALACAIMQVLLKEKLADNDYLSKFTDFDDEVFSHIRKKTPAWAASITGLTEKEIVSFARLFGSKKRAFLRLGVGFTRGRNGASNMHAVSCLPAITGAWKYLGGGAYFASFDIWNLNTSIAHADNCSNQTTRILDQSRIGAILKGNPEDLKFGPPVKAMLIQNANPALVAPDSATVREGLMREDLFLCVHEQFLTATARYADILLPASMFLELDDIYMGWGHTALTIGPKVLERYEECWSNVEVINCLAKRLGSRHASFNLSDTELVDTTLKSSGKGTLKQAAERGWIDCAPSFDDAHFLSGFPQTNNRFRFKPDWSKVGPMYGDMPKMPDHWETLDLANEKTPFRLVTPPARAFLNSSFTETSGSQSREKEPLAIMHPLDAVKMGISHGNCISIGNEKGSIEFRVNVLRSSKPGVIIAEGVWPDNYYRERVGINLLIDSTAIAPNGGVAFHDTAVWVKPVYK